MSLLTFFNGTSEEIGNVVEVELSTAVISAGSKGSNALITANLASSVTAGAKSSSASVEIKSESIHSSSKVVSTDIRLSNASAESLSIAQRSPSVKSITNAFSSAGKSLTAKLSKKALTEGISNKKFASNSDRLATSTHSASLFKFNSALRHVISTTASSAKKLANNSFASSNVLSVSNLASLVIPKPAEATIVMSSGTTAAYKTSDGSWATSTMPAAFITRRWNGSYWIGLTNGSAAVGYSLDGITWTTLTGTNLLSKAWWALAYSPPLGLWCAGAGDGTVMTSPDGITWTSRTPSIAAQNWNGCAWGNNMFVMTGRTSANFMYSYNGINWSTASSTNGVITGIWNDVIYDGRSFVAVDQNSTTRLLTSVDGVNWKQRTFTTAKSLWWLATNGNGTIVAAADNAAVAVVSVDGGLTWTNQSLPSSKRWGVTGVAWTGTKFVMACYNDSAVAESVNGLTWSSSIGLAGTYTGPLRSEWSSSLSNTEGHLTLLGTVANGTAPDGIIISPDGLHVYSINESNVVRQFSRNTSTGLLTELVPGTVATSSGARYGNISPDGKTLYVGYYGQSVITGFSRDAATGLLTSIGNFNVATHPGRPVVSPDNRFVYVGCQDSNKIYQFSRNTTTGMLTALSPAFVSTTTGCWQSVITADGKSLYTGGYSGTTMGQFSIDTDTGLLTAMTPASVTTGTAPSAQAISPDGKFVYAANGTSGTISQFSRDTSTGLLTLIGTIAANSASGLNSITISPNGKSVYAGVSGGSLYNYDRDESTGLLSIHPLNGGVALAGGAGVAVSPDGKFVYSTTNANVIKMFSRLAGSVFSQIADAISSNVSSLVKSAVKVASDSSASVVSFTKNLFATKTSNSPAIASLLKNSKTTKQTVALSIAEFSVSAVKNLMLSVNVFSSSTKQKFITVVKDAIIPHSVNTSKSVLLNKNAIVNNSSVIRRFIDASKKAIVSSTATFTIFFVNQTKEVIASAVSVTSGAVNKLLDKVMFVDSVTLATLSKIIVRSFVAVSTNSSAFVSTIIQQAKQLISFFVTINKTEVVDEEVIVTEKQINTFDDAIEEVVLDLPGQSVIKIEL